MAEPTQAEQYLLEQIRRGDNDAWAQMVDRYQGRLLAFAQVKVKQRADSEDIVQETFISFIKSLNAFRAECSLETYLFTLLRCKIADAFRKKASRNICLVQDFYSVRADTDTSPFEQIAGPEQTASWYARKDEQKDLQRKVLAEALTELVGGFKKSLNFTDLAIVELLFYGHLSNKHAAKTMKLEPNRVAVVKHRCINRIREHIEHSGLVADSQSMHFESMLSDLWQSQRLSCPKRSTVGAYLLGTLDSDWHDYVDFHLNTLGCHFCRANLEDLRAQTKETKSEQVFTRIMESTVGFLRKP